jgi:ribosomal protein S18 acetylase RimI-like enzyme
MALPTNDTVAMRTATPADADDVRRLTREAYAKWVSLLGREPKPMNADYAIAVVQHRIDLLYLAGSLAGLIEMVFQDDALLVENVAIAPALQGRGLGSRLMLHAESLARTARCRRIRLYTNQRFAENIRLYRSLGYALTGEEDLGGGTIRVDMAKSL